MGSQYIVPHPALVLRESFFDPASDAPDREAAMATAVTFAWEKAQDGLRAILEFGALLCRVEEWLKARGGVRRGPGAVSLAAWLREHCPEVNYKTAMGYRAAALGLREAAKLEADRPLLPLMGEKPLADEEEEAARSKVLDVVATSSLRLLKEAGRAGRDDAPRPPTNTKGRRAPGPLEIAEAAMQDLEAGVDSCGRVCLGDGAGALAAFPDRLRTARLRLKDCIDRLREIEKGGAK